MDANLRMQIYPYLAYAREKYPKVDFKDQEALMADLYLAMINYYNKEIPKFLGRLDRLEALKKGKEEKYLENIKKQQDGILKESVEKQRFLLDGIFNTWVNNLEESKIGIL